MSISRVKELLRQARIWWDRFHWRLARITLTTRFILGVAFLVGSLLLGGLFVLLRYADRQSMESALRIMASTLATFVGFILVALALITGRASDAKEHLEALAPSYKNLDEFLKVRGAFIKTLSSLSGSLDDRPMVGAYYPHVAPAPYTYREEYAAIESIYLHLSRHYGSPGWKDIVMGLRLRGFSSREIDRVLKNEGMFDWQPYEFFRALQKVLQVPRPYYFPESTEGYLGHLRSKWNSDRISTSLDRVQRHEQATGGRFWAAILSSIVALTASVLLVVGLTDVTAQMTIVRTAFVGVAIAWCIAIVLIIAYLTQLL